MLTFLQRFFDWLLSDEIKILSLAVKTQKMQADELRIKLENILQENQAMNEMLKNMIVDADTYMTRRLTLNDLKLKPNQLALLKSTASDFRQALYDSGEHVCLTELNECCRKTALRFRKYQMNLTLDQMRGNEIPADRTIVDDMNDRRKKLFASRHA